MTGEGEQNRKMAFIFPGWVAGLSTEGQQGMLLTGGNQARCVEHVYCSGGYETCAEGTVAGPGTSSLRTSYHMTTLILHIIVHHVMLASS